MTTREAYRLLVLVAGSLAAIGGCKNDNAGTGGKGGAGGAAGRGGSGGTGGTAGMSGTGGTAGTGGTGGAGGNSTAQPDAAVFTCIKTADDGLIADFTTDNSLNPVDGRQGGFYVYGDDVGTFDPPKPACDPYPIDISVGNPTCSGPGSFHIKATGFAKWGAAIGVDFAPAVGGSSGSGGTTATGGSGAGGASGSGGSSANAGTGGNGSGGSGSGGSSASGGNGAGGSGSGGIGFGGTTATGGSGAGGKGGSGGSSANGGNGGSGGTTATGGSSTGGQGDSGGSSASGGNGGAAASGSAGSGSGGNGSGGTIAQGGMGGGGSGDSGTGCSQVPATTIKGTYDASKYKGVSFWAKAGAKLTGVQVSFPDMYTDGGADPSTVDSSASKCGYVPGSTINCSPYLVKFGDSTFPSYKDYQIDTTWKRFDVYFADTKQDQYNIGLQGPDNAISVRYLTAMAIQVNAIYVSGSPTSNDFELWIDDINFIE
jgi:hypothetical protein